MESKSEGLGSAFAFAVPLPEPPKDQGQIALERDAGVRKLLPIIVWY